MSMYAQLLDASTVFPAFIDILSSVTDGKNLYFNIRDSSKHKFRVRVLNQGTIYSMLGVLGGVIDFLKIVLTTIGHSLRSTSTNELGLTVPSRPWRFTHSSTNRRVFTSMN